MIKIKINQINEKIKHGGFYGSWTMLGMSFKHKKLGPFERKKCKFGQYWLHGIFQKWSPLTMHISSNFNPKEVFFDFLEIL